MRAFSDRHRSPTAPADVKYSLIVSAHYRFKDIALQTRSDSFSITVPEKVHKVTKILKARSGRRGRECPAATRVTQIWPRKGPGSPFGPNLGGFCVGTAVQKASAGLQEPVSVDD